MKQFFSILLTVVIVLMHPFKAYAADESSIIQEKVQNFWEENKEKAPAVSVGIMSENELIAEQYFGKAGEQLENSAERVMEWGSISKLLVYVSLMQLEEQGQIHLEDDIREYLPKNFLQKLKYDSPITFLNLMNHNAGWQDTLTDVFIDQPEGIKNLEEALRYIEPDQINAPGEVTAYSNWGTALGGYLVERISGQSYSSYVKEHIFDPLGMSETSLSADMSDNPWVKEKRLEQICYSNTGESLGTEYAYLNLYPAGGAIGTLKDFMRFGQQFLKNGKDSGLFKKEDTLARFLSPSLFYADGVTPRGHHGIWTRQYEKTVLFHNGGTLGNTSNFVFDPIAKRAIMILTNQRNEGVFTIKMPQIVFGAAAPVSASKAPYHLSGYYRGQRAAVKGFGKISSLLKTVKVYESTSGKFMFGSDNNRITPLNDSDYLLEAADGSTYTFQVQKNQSGKLVLELPAEDFVAISSATHFGEWALIIVFILGFIYSIIMLIGLLVKVCRRKRVISRYDWIRLALNASNIVCSVIIIAIVNGLNGYTPQQWWMKWAAFGLHLNWLLMLLYCLYLAKNIQKVKLLTLKSRIGILVNGIAGLLIAVNIFYWQFFS